MFETHNKRGREIIGHLSYLLLSEDTLAATHRVREAGPGGAPKPRLLDRVRETVRARHYSRRTEKAYVHWIRRYIFFHGKRHPAEMGAVAVTSFLTSLALRTAAHVPERRPGLGVAMDLPGHPPIYGWPHGPAPPPPSPRIRPPARREGCGPRCRDCQAGHVPHLPSLVCHPPARGESRHPDRPGAARPPGCQHHDDLHACAQPGTCRSPESRRPDVPVMTGEGRETGLVADAQVISCNASRCIRAGEPSCVV